MRRERSPSPTSGVGTRGGPDRQLVKLVLGEAPGSRAVRQ